MNQAKKILVVDDAATVRAYHRQVISALGFAVEEAANGYEGLEKALAEKFDLFLVDVNMPKMDGYTMVKHLREDAGNQATPVMMISTEAETQDRDLAYQAGANIYLTKPARPDELGIYVRMLAGK